MPQIREYLPQEQAAGPAGGLAPNLEQITAAGRGIERLGQSAEEGVNYVQQRNAQEETSDGYAEIAQARLDWNQRIQDETQKGTLDVDKLKDDFENYVNTQQDQYDTPQGKNFFNRQAARLQGSLLKSAVRGQAVVAANTARADLQTALNANGNALENDPTQFSDVHDGMLETVQQYVDSGAIPASMAPQLKNAMAAELSKAAVRGYTKSNPDFAKKMLDEGAFDDYLSPDQKKQMYGEVRQGQVAQDVDQERALRLQKNQQEAAFQKWGNDNISNLVNNKLSAKDILNSPGSWEDKNRWLNMLRENQKEAIATDPAMKNDLMMRMLLPDSDQRKISDPSQIEQYVGKGISPQDYAQMNSWFDKTPEGQAINNSRAMLLDVAKSSLVNGNAFMGQKDPNGEYRLSQFTNALQQAEAQARNNQTPLKDLYDPNSKSYFGRQIQQYKATPTQIMQEQANQFKGVNVIPQNIQTQIGTTPQEASKDENLVARQTKDGRTALFDPKTKQFVRYK